MACRAVFDSKNNKFYNQKLFIIRGEQVKDVNKIKKQPANKLIKLRQRIAELEKSESKYKSAEERIKLLNNTLKAIRSVNQLIVREKNKDILLQKTCDILIKAKSYEAVWFGLLRDDRTFSTVKGSGFMKDIPIFCKQVIDGNYPYCIRNAFSQEDLLVIVDKSRTCRDCYFKNAGIGKEVAIIRVEYNNRLFGLLAIYLMPDFYINAEEETLLKEVASDLAYALHKLELEKPYKQAEEELRKERDFNKTLIQTSPVFFVAISAEGKTLMMNEMMLHTLGYTIEEVVGKDYLSTFVPEYDRKMLSKVFEGLVKKKESTLNENHVVTKDGEKLLVEWHGRPVFKANGDFDYFFGVGIDITERRELDLKLKQSYQKLEKTMEGTINTIAKIVETRDPYTAGHQLNVSKLTTAIAQEMKLPEDKIEGIRIASLVHDIGKISIPAEILSKPTKLNEIEYNLIKDHSQTGYDILKLIEFPWPIAEIVLQHHERLNGSGYPQGLKGEEILLEARIMGVADVVEAMSAHRPYRPALGIDKALEEISKNKSILYDPKVVDICLKLFKEEGFKFEL